jgi:hypothetical protein
VAGNSNQNAVTTKQEFRFCIAPLYEWFPINDETLKDLDVKNHASQAIEMKLDTSFHSDANLPPDKLLQKHEVIR